MRGEQLPLTKLCVLAALCTWPVVTCVEDFGSLPTLIETDRLPTTDDGQSIDFSSMATLGNGHIATVVYSDTVYMNGLYNGKGASSHRARIPAELNLRVHLPNEEKRRVHRQYRLDLTKGYWEENVTVDECRVTQRVYAHQHYTRLLVIDVLAQRQGAATGNILLYLNTSRGPESRDLDMSTPMSFNGGNWHSSGVTLESEMPGIGNSELYVYWTLVPPAIHIPSFKSMIRYTFIMALDSNEKTARESFETGTSIADKNPDYFLTAHQDAWQEKWSEGNIEISGNSYLAKLTRSSLYYLLSSLPSTNSHRQMSHFGGVSPIGLAHGGARDQYQGHVTRDQEMWIFPAILPFNPNLAKTLLNYRVATKAAAQQMASNLGFQGVMYPWESAATGSDVSRCENCSRERIYLNGEISLAIRQFVSLTRDKRWLQEEGGCDLVRELANFWFSRVDKNKMTGRHEIKSVTPPDSNHQGVDNSVYTNAIASLALHFSKYIACMCNVDVNTFAPFEWIEAAESLHWEFNNTGQFHPEFRGYTGEGAGKSINQADVVLLGYPLLWKMPKQVRENDLRLYVAATSTDPPMGKAEPPPSPSTTWSMYTIGWLEVGSTARAESMFEKSYKPYVAEPFKIWSEYPYHTGAVNHISAMAGYIQTLLYGYGGLRLYLDKLVMDPRLPSGVQSMAFIDLDYLGAKFDVRVTSLTVDIQVTRIGIHPLVLTTSESSHSYYFTKGARIPIKRGQFTVQSKTSTGCPLPTDIIKPLVVSPSYMALPFNSGSGMQWNAVNMLLLVCNLICGYLFMFGDIFS